MQFQLANKTPVASVERAYTGQMLLLHQVLRSQCLVYFKLKDKIKDEIPCEKKFINHITSGV